MNTKNTLFNPNWITDKFIYIMLGIFPIWTGFEGYSNITASKFAFFVSVTSVWIVLLIAALIISRIKLHACVSDYIVIAFMLLASVSSLLSPYGLVSILGAGRYDGLLSFLLYCIIFLGVKQFAKPKRSYLTAFSISLSICCIISFIQLMGYNPFNLFPSDYTYYDHGIKFSSEILGNIGNVDVFATVLSLYVPGTFAFCMLSDNRKDKLYLIPASLVLFLCMKISVSSLKLALAVSAIIFIVLMIKSRKFINGLYILIIIVFLFIASTYIQFSIDGVTFGKAESENTEQSDESTVFQIKQILSGHIEDSYGSGRIGIWRQALETFDERPVIGTGQGTIAKRVNIEYSREIEETGKTMRTFVDNAHNEYLGYLMDDGIIGLVLYLSLIISTIIYAFKSRSYIKEALLCGMFGYWTQSFFGIGLCLVLPIVWLCWGLCNSLTEKNIND